MIDLAGDLVRAVMVLAILAFVVGTIAVLMTKDNDRD